MMSGRTQHPARLPPPCFCCCCGYMGWSITLFILGGLGALSSLSLLASGMLGEALTEMIISAGFLGFGWLMFTNYQKEKMDEEKEDEEQAALLNGLRQQQGQGQKAVPSPVQSMQQDAAKQQPPKQSAADDFTPAEPPADASVAIQPQMRMFNDAFASLPEAAVACALRTAAAGSQNSKRA